MNVLLGAIFVNFFIIMSSEALQTSPPPTTITNTRQLIRNIQACKSDVPRALKLLGDCQEEGPHLAVLHVCGKAKNSKVAVEMYHKFKSESCRALAISVCGRCGNYKQAIELLKKKTSPPGIQSYNAAIAACGHAQQWKEALEIFESMPESMLNTFSCNAVLTSMSKCKRGKEALALLHRVKKSCGVDRNSYHLTIQALSKQGSLDKALALFQEMKQHPDTFPKDSTYEVLITAHSKRRLWDIANELEQERQDNNRGRSGASRNKKRKRDGDNETSRNSNKNKRQATICSFDFWDMPATKKVGRGKYARWEFGTYQAQDDNVKMTIAVHPHTNPAKNGISLLLVDSTTKKKIASAILVNSASANTTTLLGSYIEPKYRKNGYSKVMLAIWFQLAMEAKIRPQTGIIHKPLLALVLQHTFQCTSKPAMGVTAEVSASQDDKNSILLYSTSAKNLEGAFSPRDVKREGIEFCKHPPKPRGRPVRIGAAFVPPKDETVLQQALRNVLDANGGTVRHKLTPHELRRVFLGEK